MQELQNRTSPQPLARRLVWFAALWLAGVGSVGLLSLILHFWLSPR